MSQLPPLPQNNLAKAYTQTRTPGPQIDNRYWNTSTNCTLGTDLQYTPHKRVESTYGIGHLVRVNSCPGLSLLHRSWCSLQSTCSGGHAHTRRASGTRVTTRWSRAWKSRTSRESPSNSWRKLATCRNTHA